MRGVACVTLVGLLSGASTSACGGSDNSRKSGSEDAGPDGASSNSNGSGGRGTGGRAGTGGADTNPNLGSGGVVDAGAGGAVEAGAGGAADAAVEASQDAATVDAAPEASATRCVDGGTQVCEWFRFSPRDGGAELFTGSVLTLELAPAVPDLASATADVVVCDCDLYGSYGSCNTTQVAAVISGDGRSLVVDVSSLVAQFDTAWVQQVTVEATTVCGDVQSFRVRNQGTYSMGACTDSVTLLLNCV